jgi:hypothetical protein
VSLPSTGYSAARLATLLVDARAAIWALLGQQVPLESGTLLGNLVDLFMAQLDTLSEASQDLYDSFDVRAATGVYLDSLCSLVGVTREPATYSTVSLTLATTGAAPVTVPLGSSVADAAGVEWLSTVAATIPALGSVVVVFSPAVTGPIASPAGTLTVPGTATIKTPISGWTVVLHGADAVPGQDRETDSALRTRRQASLQVLGSASTNAIRAALTALSFVDVAFVVDNKTDVATVVGGVTLPAHSFLVVVYPSPATVGERQTIAETIWRRAPAGILSVSGAGVLTSWTATVTDAAGSAQTVNFSAAGTHAITIAITVAVDLALYGGAPGSGGAGDLALIAALQAATLALPLGATLTAMDCYLAAHDVPGLLNVTGLTIGGGSPTVFEHATLAGGAVTIT